MTSGDEDWVKAAMTDDSMVVYLLIRLHHSTPQPLPPLKTAAFQLEWTLRQRRSKPVPIASCSNKTGARASPTTPLSWSGGCGGEGGAEESSRPSYKHSDCSRSKANEDGEKIISKRSRKKKTLAELKEEENRLMKERRQLKRDIAELHLNLENQRARNESLKRVKIELQPLYSRGQNSDSGGINSGDLQQNTTAFHSIPPTVPPIVLHNHAVLQYSTTKQKDDAASNPKIMLPDLNMSFEEEHSLEVACKVS